MIPHIDCFVHLADSICWDWSFVIVGVVAYPVPSNLGTGTQKGSKIRLISAGSSKLLEEEDVEEVSIYLL